MIMILLLMIFLSWRVEGRVFISFLGFEDPT